MATDSTQNADDRLFDNVAKADCLKLQYYVRDTLQQLHNRLEQPEVQLSTAEAEGWLAKAEFIKQPLLTKSYGCKRRRDGTTQEVLRKVFVPNNFQQVLQRADDIASLAEQRRLKQYPLCRGPEYNAASGQSEFKTRHQVTASEESVYTFGYTQVLA